ATNPHTIDFTGEDLVPVDVGSDEVTFDEVLRTCDLDTSCSTVTRNHVPGAAPRAADRVGVAGAALEQDTELVAQRHLARSVRADQVALNRGIGNGDSNTESWVCRDDIAVPRVRPSDLRTCLHSGEIDAVVVARPRGLREDAVLARD